MDAVTLSMSELSLSGSVDLETASQAIVIAAVANTFVKGGIVMIGGDKRLRKAILPGLILILAVAIVVVFVF